MQGIFDEMHYLGTVRSDLIKMLSVADEMGIGFLMVCDNYLDYYVLRAFLLQHGKSNDRKIFLEPNRLSEDDMETIFCEIRNHHYNVIVTVVGNRTDPFVQKLKRFMLTYFVETTESAKEYLTEKFDAKGVFSAEKISLDDTLTICNFLTKWRDLVKSKVILSNTDRQILLEKEDNPIICKAIVDCLVGFRDESDFSLDRIVGSVVDQVQGATVSRVLVGLENLVSKGVLMLIKSDDMVLLVPNFALWCRHPHDIETLISRVPDLKVSGIPDVRLDSQLLSSLLVLRCRQILASFREEVHKSSLPNREVFENRLLQFSQVTSELEKSMLQPSFIPNELSPHVKVSPLTITASDPRDLAWLDRLLLSANVPGEIRFSFSDAAAHLASFMEVASPTDIDETIEIFHRLLDLFWFVRDGTLDSELYQSVLVVLKNRALGFRQVVKMLGIIAGLLRVSRLPPELDSLIPRQLRVSSVYRLEKSLLIVDLLTTDGAQYLLDDLSETMHRLKPSRCGLESFDPTLRSICQNGKEVYKHSVEIWPGHLMLGSKLREECKALIESKDKIDFSAICDLYCKCVNPSKFPEDFGMQFAWLSKDFDNFREWVNMQILSSYPHLSNIHDITEIADEIKNSLIGDAAGNRILPQKTYESIILFLLDGLGKWLYEYCKEDEAFKPTYNELKTRIVAETTLFSVFPTTTGVAHISLLTGRSPCDHGIISDTLYIDGKLVRVIPPIGEEKDESRPMDPRDVLGDSILRVLGQAGVDSCVVSYAEPTKNSYLGGWFRKDVGGNKYFVKKNEKDICNQVHSIIHQSSLRKRKAFILVQYGAPDKLGHQKLHSLLKLSVIPLFREISRLLSSLRQGSKALFIISADHGIMAPKNFRKRSECKPIPPDLNIGSRLLYVFDETKEYMDRNGSKPQLSFTRNDMTRLRLLTNRSEIRNPSKIIQFNFYETLDGRSNGDSAGFKHGGMSFEEIVIPLITVEA